MKRAMPDGGQTPVEIDVSAPEVTGLLDALPGYAFLVDERHTILQANEAALEIFEAGARDLIGGYCPKLVHGSEEVWPECPLEEAAHKGQPMEREVFEKKSGRWLKSTVAPIQGRTPAGRRIFLHTLTDITSIKYAQKMKDDFLSIVSHELKTPLTVIIGALHTANSPGIPPEEAKALQQDAIDSAAFLASMIENLLELSQAQNGGFELKRECIDFGEIAWRVAHKFNLLAPKRIICVDLPPRLPDIAADKDKVERILVNLLGNAVKFSPKGGDITISARPENSLLKISVRDHGRGIPMEDQKRLFHSFEQLAGERHAMNGLGLGLKVCRVLVEAQGGRIWLESQPGSGSNFLFTIPVFSPQETGDIPRRAQGRDASN